MGFLRKASFDRLTADSGWCYTFATLFRRQRSLRRGLCYRLGAGQRRPPICLAG